MYVSVEELCGCNVCCRDGLMGQVQDVILSRSVWCMRYAVVNTGPDFGNLHVLLPLTDAEQLDARQRHLRTPLVRRELEWAAPHDAARPLTRRQERLFAQRYGWPSEWLRDERNTAPPVPPPLESEKAVSQQEQELERMLADGPETQSAARMIASFAALTCDRQKASIETLIVDTEGWAIPCLAVKLAAATRPVVVATQGIQGIDWLHKCIYLVEDAVRVSGGPRYAAQLSTRMALMRQLGDFYGGRGARKPAASMPGDHLAGVPI